MGKVFAPTAAALVAILVLGLATPTGARADFQGDRQRCNGNDTHPDIRIGACTRQIQSGLYEGADLAIAFNKRGIAFYRKRRYDQAIADYSEAIRLNPHHANAFNNRGLAYKKTAGTTAPSRITARRSGSTRAMPVLSTTGAWFTKTNAGTAAPSRTTAGPSASPHGSAMP